MHYLLDDDIFNRFPAPEDSEYFNKYKEFIIKVYRSRLNEYFQYSDCHHVIPKCLGGTDYNNLIFLTYKEHYEAHYYLALAYFSNYELLFTCVMMHGNTSKYPSLEEGSSNYEELRMNFVNMCKQRMSSESNPMKDPNISQRFSKENNPEHAAMLKYYTVNFNPMNSAVCRDKVAASKLGKIWINNGEVQTYVDESELSTYLDLGYVRGMLKRRGSDKKENYDCHCRFCGKEYKGGKYSSVCKECYSKQKSEQFKRMREVYDNE